jgi:predicted ABC-type ATPase
MNPSSRSERSPIRAEPTVVVIAGPNGAGKTTYAESVLRVLGIREFVNADRIAQGLSGLNTDSVAIEAGRLMLRRLRVLAAERASFGFETTLSSRSFAPFLRGLCTQGYVVRIFYVMLPSAAEAYRRVRRRVEMGGHSVPRDIVYRRFARSAVNLFELYLPLAQSWVINENPFGNAPKEVARGMVGFPALVTNERLWNRLRSLATKAGS